MPIITHSIALSWIPERKTKRGRQKETWRPTIEKKMRAFGFALWTDSVRSAHDRIRWRVLVSSPILHEERRN